MQLIKMTGGLGNQMFIYAFYLQMKKRFSDVHIDLSDMVHYHVHHGYEMNRVFNLPHIEKCYPQSLKKVAEFLFFKTILERKLKDPFNAYKTRPTWPLVYYKGFYQTEKYFNEVADDIRKAFTFNAALFTDKNRALETEILNNSNAVSLHVRRGDYLQPKHWNAVGCVCQNEYYNNAIAEIKDRVEAPHFYVFSDDIKWVKDNFELENVTFIDWNTGNDSWQDMMLMSRCKHNIIANSTFSWWGAWLNPNKQKIVIAPNRWFANHDAPNIIPDGWIKVATN